jgi:hypothetical protein
MKDATAQRLMDVIKGAIESLAVALENDGQHEEADSVRNEIVWEVDEETKQ